MEIGSNRISNETFVLILYLLISPSVVGEALIKGLEDDSLNGVALQLLTEEPRVLFVDQNSLVVTSDSVKTGLAQKATQYLNN